MIRSPDTKFGAFIAAWFVVAIYYLHPKQKGIILVLASLFLISNLAGMFSNGAISSNKGDSKTTTFIQDPEAKLILDLIDNHSNAVVISNFSSCAGEWYEGKFHTCHGLISTSTRHQFITSENHQDLSKNIDLYWNFPILVILNKRLKGDNSNPITFRVPGDFQEIYKSSNYSLHFKGSSYEPCQEKQAFSCIKKDGVNLLSLPENSFRYYFPKTPYTLDHQLVATKDEISASWDKIRALFLLLYVTPYSFCILWILRLTGRPKSNLCQP